MRKKKPDNQGCFIYLHHSIHYTVPAGKVFELHSLKNAFQQGLTPFDTPCMIYHLVTTQAWERFLREDRDIYRPPSLKTEGFIHCSTRAQLLDTAQRHFEGEEQLVVLGIVEKRIKPLLKWEPGREGQVFPHIYGGLPVSAIETTDLLSRNAAGEWEF
ncbi:MAG: DUF952 domain-containing protein [Bacteroidetes bacterium]|nr:MAG: DUF952 domain-containing protein [Bacteroidota bacterium]